MFMDEFNFCLRGVGESLTMVLLDIAVGDVRSFAVIYFSDAHAYVFARANPPSRTSLRRRSISSAAVL